MKPIQQPEGRHVTELRFTMGQRPGTQLGGYKLEEQPGDALDLTLGNAPQAQHGPGFGPDGPRRAAKAEDEVTNVLEATVVSKARDWKSAIETGGPDGGLTPLGDPGDPLRDRVGIALMELWRALNVPPDDRCYRADAWIAPGTLSVRIRPVGGSCG